MVAAHLPDGLVVMTRIDLGDVELFVAQRGVGAPLLLVHGFPLDHRMWSGQWDALAGEAHLIAPDLRGFGQSGVTAGTVTMAQFADDLATLLDRLKIEQPVTFCGLSMGGYIAWEFWRRHRPRLARLILCDTRAVADPPEVARGRLQAAGQVLQSGPQWVADPMIERLFAAATLATRRELVDATREVMHATAPAGMAAALRGMAERLDVEPLLGDIDVPALVICGAEDAISAPAEMRQMADRLPQATFVEIPASGHLAPLENPTAVNDAMRTFLRAGS